MTSWHFETDSTMGDVIVLDTPHRFVFNGEVYTIPAGFRSDGCSCPRVFWNILSPKVDAKTLLPSVIHDWMYHEKICTRKEADEFYKHLLIKAGFPKWKAELVYAGVRIGGKSHWQK